MDLVLRLMDGISRQVVLWGGTGQAKVMRPLLAHYGARVVAVFDDTPNLVPPFPDVPLYHGWNGFTQWIATQKRDALGFCITIGNPHGRVRMALSEKLKAEGLRCTPAIHPHSFIESNVEIGEGCQIHAGAIIGAEARLGRQCIVNTNASVDHECVLADGVEIAPGATLCGLVHVGTNGWICAGATVLPGRTVHDDAVVGAGAVVIADVPSGMTVVGVPAVVSGRRET